MNHVILDGRVCNIKTYPMKGKNYSFVSFAIRQSRPKTVGENGEVLEWEEASFYNCKIFDNDNSFENNVEERDKLVVVGNWKKDSYTTKDEDGNEVKRTSDSIMVRNWYIVKDTDKSSSSSSGSSKKRRKRRHDDLPSESQESSQKAFE